MERRLEIQKFRNIGLHNKEKLLINRSLKKGEIGDLIIVIGANNSGKSNVLDALSRFNDKKLERRDVTTLSYDEKDRKPSISLVTKDGSKDNPIEYSYTITYNGDRTITNVSYPETKRTSPIGSKDELVRACRFMTERYSHNSAGYNEWHKLVSTLQASNNLTQKQLVDKENEAINKLLKIKEAGTNGTLINTISNYASSYGIFRAAFPNNEENNSILKNSFEKKYGIRFMPQVIKYTETKISNSDLSSSHYDVSSNTFFKSLFKAIKVDMKEVTNVYSDFDKLSDRGVLKSFSKKINKKLKDIAKRFNTLYFVNDDTYKFEIDCESSKIYFTMFRDGESISLDYQSTGFRWFFNLYFNLLTSNDLQAGDIIIMDEPATHLHPCGQIELRKMLKEFAIRNDLTIILATHSPFLVDIDNLDELRVVSMHDNVSAIENDFSTINTTDSDALMPIKKALTVGNHVLYDPDKKVVFVEGITDYNYMVAFRNMLKYDDIIFLPVQGIGNITSSELKSKQKEISKKLIEIKKHNPILMVDGDRTGKSIQSVNKESELEVFTLSDIDSNFKNIEDLFSEQDQEKFAVKSKRSYLSALFKTHHANVKEVSADTRNNFKKLFEYISKNL